ncbi:MAG TPA: ABC transporter ATP-binding protein [Virgibacillus sp.]|nr:ABC transporter ATP-binding protein [Virgibacillus sp.]
MFTVDSISIKYDQKNIVENVTFSVEKGEVISIIGPNGSGKSTLLKAISGTLPYHKGSVNLDGQSLKKMKSKQIARKMCMLSQRNQAPSDMKVRDLITYGRLPHKRWFQSYNDHDRAIVDWALEKTYLTEFQDRLIDSLSGGESQRAWIAMALAQQPEVLLLDEPTTYLDISHQHEVLELIQELNQQMDMTVLMVLHDLNQASFYSNRVIVIRSGTKDMIGTPKEVMTEDMIRRVYCMHCEIQCPSMESNPRIHLLRTAK